MQSTTEGPLGFPMTDDQARATEIAMNLAAGPFQHLTLKSLPLEAHSRTDISWITTETPDRVNHVVLAAGMDDTAYAHNPIVTLNHNYDTVPIGRSLWRKQARHGATRGIQAMTHYPPKPAAIAGDWPPDIVFHQILAGLLNSKSIGFIPLKIREPEKHNDPLLILEWALIEYAVGAIPTQPDATVISVTKTLLQPPPPVAVSLLQRLHDLDIDQLIRNSLDILRGTI